MFLYKLLYLKQHHLKFKDFFWHFHITSFYKKKNGQNCFKFFTNSLIHLHHHVQNKPLKRECTEPQWWQFCFGWAVMDNMPVPYGFKKNMFWLRSSGNIFQGHLGAFYRFIRQMLLLKSICLPDLFFLHYTQLYSRDKTHVKWWLLHGFMYMLSPILSPSWWTILFLKRLNRRGVAPHPTGDVEMGRCQRRVRSDGQDFPVVINST